VHVVWERLYGRMVRRAIPSLDQYAFAVLPVMTRLGHHERSMYLQKPFCHLDKTSVGEHNAVAVVQDFFEFCILHHPANNLYITHSWADAEQFIDLTEILLNHQL
jgi:hypothetical protein